jgi:hypothetical protein
VQTAKRLKTVIMTRAWFLILVLQWGAPKETRKGPPRYINITISSLLHNPTVIKDKCGKNTQLISDESESKVFAVVETQDNPFWSESKTVVHIGRS